MMQRQTGVALVTALLVVALATSIAVAMVSRQQVDIRRSGNLLQYEQALLYIQGMEGWAGRVLYADVQDNQTDYLEEDWATQLPPMPVEGGQIAGAIEDLNARFNLNMLFVNGQVNTVAVDCFRRLLMQLDVSAGVADALVDWLDDDDKQRFPDGAEDDLYLGLEQPYRTAKAEVTSRSELLLLHNMTTEDYAKLAPFVTALPGAAMVNVNTVSVEVLQAMIPGITAADAETLVSGRGKTGYADMNAFTGQQVLQGKTVPTDLLAVSSDYFVVTSHVQFGRITTTFQSMLYRDKQTGTHLVQRAQGAL
jgi:general secretion pathway protein K